jgi:hypothetical protein
MYQNKQPILHLPDDGRPGNYLLSLKVSCKRIVAAGRGSGFAGRTVLIRAAENGVFFLLQDTILPAVAVGIWKYERIMPLM